jgi:hypothetical protein
MYCFKGEVDQRLIVTGGQSEGYGPLPLSSSATFSFALRFGVDTANPHEWLTGQRMNVLRELLALSG